MLTYSRIAIVGSREFNDYEQLKSEIDKRYAEGDWLVSGGARGADSMAQRYAKERGIPILVIYPRWRIDGVFRPGAGFERNKMIVENSDVVLAFYQKGRFQEGGTANTASWSKKLGVPLFEFEENNGGVS